MKYLLCLLLLIAPGCGLLTSPKKVEDAVDVVRLINDLTLKSNILETKLAKASSELAALPPDIPMTLKEIFGYLVGGVTAVTGAAAGVVKLNNKKRNNTSPQRVIEALNKAGISLEALKSLAKAGTKS